MSFSHTYRQFCNLNFYHQYFLNDGESNFDDPGLPDLKAEQLAKYDTSTFLTIIPSEETLKKLEGFKVVFKATKTGFTLWIRAEDTPTPNVYKPTIEIPQNEQFQFLIYITDSIFENYSTVKNVPRLPFYFSNKKPLTELGPFSEIDMEADMPHTAVDNYTLSAFTYDEVTATLSVKEKQQLFGIITLNILADTAAKSLLDPSGETQDPPPNFKIQLRNRETIWRYLDATDGSVLHNSPTVKPLVKNGVVVYLFGGERRPSAEPNRLIFVKDPGGTIIETISEIFI